MRYYKVNSKEYDSLSEKIYSQLDFNKKEEEHFYNEWKEFTALLESVLNKLNSEISREIQMFQISDDWDVARYQSISICNESFFIKDVVEKIKYVVDVYENSWAVFIEFSGFDWENYSKYTEDELEKNYPNGQIVVTKEKIYFLDSGFDYHLVLQKTNR
jgi:hypothetical protein